MSKLGPMELRALAEDARVRFGETGSWETTVLAVLVGLDRIRSRQAKPKLAERLREKNAGQNHATAQRVLMLVADKMGVAVHHVCAGSRNRKPQVVHARWIAMWILRELVGLSGDETAAAVGCENHSAVTFGLARLANHPELKAIALDVWGRVSDHRTQQELSL